MRTRIGGVVGAGALVIAGSWVPALDGQAGPSSGLRVAVHVAPGLVREALDGRVLLMVSTDVSAEPRFQIENAVTTQQIFGIDVEGLAAGAEAVFDARVLGYPLDSLARHRRRASIRCRRCCTATRPSAAPTATP